MKFRQELLQLKRRLNKLIWKNIGVEYSSQNELIKAKNRQTHLKLSESIDYCEITNKSAETCLKKYRETPSKYIFQLVKYFKLV